MNKEQRSVSLTSALTESSRNFYTKLYRETDNRRKRKQEIFDSRWADAERNTNDSPLESRRSILQRFINGSSLSRETVVLDLGAGRQILEADFEAARESFCIPKFALVTLDIADIVEKQLLTREYFPKSNNYHHVQADGASLPFTTSSIDVAISNMALDFMPEKARQELFRVLKNGAPLFLNLHHPSKIPPDYYLNEKIATLARQMWTKIEKGGKPTTSQERRMEVLKHNKFLKDYRILFERDADIRKAFEESGFTVKRVNTNSDRISNTWWEVDAVKI